MKVYVSFLIVLLFNILCQAEIKIEYRINRLHGLINFILAASDQPHTSPGLKEVFVRSKFNTKENQDSLASFNNLQDSLMKELEFKASAPGRFNGFQIQDQILAQSFYAKDLQDLNQRTLGLMPMTDQIRFFAILKKFEPIYAELVWKTAGKQLKKHKAKLEKLAKNIDLQKMFKAAETFYRGNWPEDVPFAIGLYPIPFLKDFKNASNSHSFGSVEEHGVLIGIDDDENDSFGVIFHELCHSLYSSQSNEFKNEFYKYFSDSKQLERFQVYDWINEALATAIGNGWAYERANKVMERKSWYNEPTIDALAKEIFTETKTYLNENKAIDKDFIEHAITSYAKKFPDAVFSFDRVLNKIVFVHNISITSNSAAKALLRKNFRIFDFDGSAPLTHEKTLAAISDSSWTVVIVFSEKDTSDLETLAKKIPILKTNLNVISKMKNKNILSLTNENNRSFILVKIDKEDDLQLAFSKMLELKKIDPKNPLQTF